MGVELYYCMAQRRDIEPVPFELRLVIQPDGTAKKALFVNNIEVDYQIDMNDYIEALQMGPAFRKAVQDDICQHFASCVSDCLGRRVTMAEIKQATKTGWI